MQEELADRRALAGRGSARTRRCPRSAPSRCVLVDAARRQLLAGEDLRVHAHDEHLFVVGAVEDADPAALGQVLQARATGNRGRAPRCVGALNEETSQPCGLMPDMTCLIVAVLAGGVHRLEDQQQRPAILGVEPLLQLGEPLDAALEELAGLFLHVEAQRVAGIDVFHAKAVVGDAVLRRKL